MKETKCMNKEQILGMCQPSLHIDRCRLYSACAIAQLVQFAQIVVQQEQNSYVSQTYVCRMACFVENVASFGVKCVKDLLVCNHFAATFGESGKWYNGLRACCVREWFGVQFWLGTNSNFSFVVSSLL